MITVEKLEKGTYFDDAFKISFRYDPTTVAKVKELAERRYLPEDRAWEIPAHELPALIEKVGLSNIKSEEAVVQALNTKEIEDKREATQERLKGIKPVRDFDFKTAPLPHQIEAFNYGMEKNSLLIGDEQGLGKTRDLSRILKPSSINYLAFNIQVWYNNSKRRYIMRAITVDADTGKRIYTRKEVADLVGASTQSIRLWEDAGAIPASVRDEGGYRYWYEEDLEAIKAYASLPRKAKLKK